IGHGASASRRLPWGVSRKSSCQRWLARELPLGYFIQHECSSRPGRSSPRTSPAALASCAPTLTPTPPPRPGRLPCLSLPREQASACEGWDERTARGARRGGTVRAGPSADRSELVRLTRLEGGKLDARVLMPRGDGH